MSDWIIPIALVLAWVTIAGSTWLRIRYVEKRAVRGYARGFEDGWKQHVAAQLSEDPEYRRAYTEGWSACSLLIKQYEKAQREASYENGFADGMRAKHR